LYERDDGEYPVYEEDEPRPKNRRKFYIGIALLTYSLIGVALAQTITLNTTGRVEFGQGIVTLTACDSFISINLTPSPSIHSGTNASGESYVNSSRVQEINFSGLDTKACAGRSIRVQLFDKNNAAMNLFSEDASSPVSRVNLIINSNENTARNVAVTLLNARDENIGFSDAYQSLTFDPDTASYSVIFASPLALMSDVYRLTVETTNSAWLLIKLSEK
jgi:hypothetical protein